VIVHISISTSLVYSQMSNSYCAAALLYACLSYLLFRNTHDEARVWKGGGELGGGSRKLTTQIDHKTLRWPSREGTAVEAIPLHILKLQLILNVSFLSRSWAVQECIRTRHYKLRIHCFHFCSYIIKSEYLNL
jgi:hypothetical protein